VFEFPIKQISEAGKRGVHDSVLRQ